MTADSSSRIEPPSRAFEEPLRVIALHDLLYCERLFFLTEVEGIQCPNPLIYAGRRLHNERLPLDDESPETRSFEVANEEWGLVGKVDAVRRRDGGWVAYEHKRGRCRRGDKGEVLAWPSDRIQAVAYAVLIEAELRDPVREARIRYHSDNVTAILQIDDTAREELRATVIRARELRRSTARPPVHSNEQVCVRCSLAPVCLPEEERLGSLDATALDLQELPSRNSGAQPRLFPSNRERQTLHVTAQKAYVSRSSETLVVKTDDGAQRIPIEQIDALVIHGYGQVTTQALNLCSARGVAVQWITAGGRFSSGLAISCGRVQQRIRQYHAFTQSSVRLDLTRRTIVAKVESQLRYILRGTRGSGNSRDIAQPQIDRIRESLAKLATADSLDTIRGLEGLAAKSYFEALPTLLTESVPECFRPSGRSKHPPRDRFNALLSFGYALLFALVHRTLLEVGLEPAFGYFHQPRTPSPPLVSDVMEIFRVMLVDMPVVGSVNRQQWDPDTDFTVTNHSIWLSDSGRKKAIGLFEQRLCESHKHPFTGQSLTYSRMVELEVRLLEKEWSGAPGLFAQLRLRSFHTQSPP
jgi:CRISPR-associated protein Cas1